MKQKVISLVLVITALMVFFLSNPASAAELEIATYNVESPNFNPKDTTVDKVVEEIEKHKGPILWGLQEVLNKKELEQFTQAMGSNFASTLGKTGKGDRLAIAYDQNELELIGKIKNLSNSGGARSPLVGQFRVISDGTEFLFMVNHFNRGNEDKRNKQATFVRNWASKQSLPTIIVGDFNFDYDIDKQKGNKAFKRLNKKEVLKWIKPNCLTSNTCPDRGTQCNPKYNSILDAVFVGGTAKNWLASSSIVPFDCEKESEGFPDHRIVIAKLASKATAFKLQLLHASDWESGLEALEDLPRFSAVLNALKDDYPNTLILSSGDNYIPSPFLFAGGDPSLNETPVGKAGIGHADIEILNQLGIQASTFGNHDFDLGTSEVQKIIEPSKDYRGTLFPYLSANLDFSTEVNLKERITPNGQEISTIAPGKVAGTGVITVNGEKIGIVGATTPLLPLLSGSDDITVFPSDATDYDALATKIQAAVDELTATGINKVILLAHMQQLNIERDELAPRLRDVDIIVAGGSHTLLSDETDHLRAGDSSGGAYPILKTNVTGEPIAIVNTDANSKYVGRLVVDFDEKGLIIPSSIDQEISGAYATDEEGVTAVEGTPDAEIIAITDALREVITTQDSNTFGYTKVFLRGDRTFVRTEETNLGNLTADANLAYAKTVDPATVISLKNGGSIRSNIGVISAADGGTDPEDFELLPPIADPIIGKEEGEISQLDITNSLRFNNGLTLFTLTAQQLVQSLEHGVAGTKPGATPGQFPQVGGLNFSFDPTRPAQNRIISLVVKGNTGEGEDIIVKDGQLIGDPERLFRTVSLNYLVGGGDNYPFPQFLQEDPALFNRVDLLGEPDDDLDGVLDPQEDLNKNGVRDAAISEPFEGVANFAAFGSEQDALAEYLHQVYPTAQKAFNQSDTPPSEDKRIQTIQTGT